MSARRLLQSPEAELQRIVGAVGPCQGIFSGEAQYLPSERAEFVDGNLACPAFTEVPGMQRLVGKDYSLIATPLKAATPMGLVLATQVRSPCWSMEYTDT